MTKNILGSLRSRSHDLGAFVESINNKFPSCQATDTSDRARATRKLHTCCTKYVAAGKLPHSSKKLSETTTEAGHTNDNIGHGNSAGADVVERKNESR